MCGDSTPLPPAAPGPCAGHRHSSGHRWDTVCEVRMQAAPTCSRTFPHQQRMQGMQQTCSEMRSFHKHTNCHWPSTCNPLRRSTPCTAMVYRLHYTQPVRRAHDALLHVQFRIMCILLASLTSNVFTECMRSAHGLHRLHRVPTMDACFPPLHVHKWRPMLPRPCVVRPPT